MRLDEPLRCVVEERRVAQPVGLEGEEAERVFGRVLVCLLCRASAEIRGVGIRVGVVKVKAGGGEFDSTCISRRREGGARSFWEEVRVYARGKETDEGNGRRREREGEERGGEGRRGSFVSETF